MILYLFIICVSLMIFLSYKENKTFLNLVTLLFFPYLIIIPINNFFFTSLGFYEIYDFTILILLLGLFSYFIGTLFVKTPALYINKYLDVHLFHNLNMKLMTKILYFIGIIALIKLALTFRSNLTMATEIDMEGYISRGWIGHLLLIGYILTPYVFLYWTYQKKFYFLLPVLIIICCSFLSFIKYHVIGLVIMIYLFTGLYKKKVFVKGGIFLLGGIIILFFLNYFISFLLSDIDVENEFYLNHLWKYIAGSFVYDNYIFSNSIDYDQNMFYKIGNYLTSLPNMFLSVFNIELFPDRFFLEYKDINQYGETGNVVDVFGALYPTKGSPFLIFIYFGLIFIIGMISKFIYIYRLQDRNVIKYPDMFIVVFLTFFVTLSFFAPYAVLPIPWELLVWSLILPRIFLKKYSLKSNLKSL